MAKAADRIRTGANVTTPPKVAKEVIERSKYEPTKTFITNQPQYTSMTKHDYTQIVNVPLLYVAGAYKSSYGVNGVLLNIKKAEMVSIALIRNGWHVFTPHKNTAGYEQYEDGTLNKTTWIEMDLNILSRCNVLFVMNNWESSIGTQKEIHFASVHDIPTVFEDECPAGEFFPGDEIRG